MISFDDPGHLPAPAATTTTTAASTTPTKASASAASRSHAGGTAVAIGARIRSVVSPVSAAEGVPVSTPAARDIPISDAIPSACATPVTNAASTCSVA